MGRLLTLLLALALAGCNQDRSPVAPPPASPAPVTSAPVTSATPEEAPSAFGVACAHLMVALFHLPLESVGEATVPAGLLSEARAYDDELAVLASNLQRRADELDETPALRELAAAVEERTRAIDVLRLRLERRHPAEEAELVAGVRDECRDAFALFQPLGDVLLEQGADLSSLEARAACAAGVEQGLALARGRAR